MLFRSEVAKRRIRIKNRPDVFGRQLYIGANDEVIGEEPDLLITATTISVTEVKELAEKYGGIAFPSHVDRPAHGILQMLGEIDLQFIDIVSQKSFVCTK